MGQALIDEGRITAAGVSPNGNCLTFHTSEDGTESERVIITDSGSVGIGTSTPAAKLDVSGTTRFGNLVTDTHQFTGSILVDKTSPTTEPALAVDCFNNDITLLRANAVSAGTNGFSVKYLGTGTGDLNRFALVMDNITGTDVDAILVDQDGDVTVGSDFSVSGSLIASVALSGAVGSEITSTSYSLSADDRGKTLLFSSSATQGITCSSGLNVGYNATFVQMGSGQLELTASGVSVLNRQGHTKSAGLYAAVSVVIVSADTYILAGDTSA